MYRSFRNRSRQMPALGKPSVLLVDPKYLNVRMSCGEYLVLRWLSLLRKPIKAGRQGNLHIRKTVLISPSDHWPRWRGSLSIEFLETKDGYNYFRYSYSPSYDQAQRAFDVAQAIHDLNAVASVLVYHPYHLDLLLTMADYFRFVGEHQMSADAIAKCLYALECAWHPMFTPLQGNCQLKLSHDSNKPLFKALFTHMKNMDRRGCHRSALEVCKFLLALDSDDPMGAMFCLDYFAVRAGEYQDESSDNTCADTAKASSADLVNQALMLHPTSLLPWVNYGGLEDGTVDENQVNEQGQANEDQ
ncbi:Translocon at the outer envelope membrane of chloroplasts 33 [Hibiscus syriacus]|uniref:Translocon at the outer envelope membrane of chloroplasts 33 n=1 Tax=Hibiscus syriacus TaxID=106335 RepID=A0A6A2X6V4_HIBSY|nr:Translocon at the outer envelope membrane of chloroplasts 33 [Hibiscus syriacus]